MYKKLKLNSIDDYFKTYTERGCEKTFFYRMTSYSHKSEEFLLNYLKEVKKSGKYINKNLQNPSLEKINYFIEILGNDFVLDNIFIENQISKWLLQISKNIKLKLAEFLFLHLTLLKERGKNQNIIKNTYIKYMCWLYYDFQILLNNLEKKGIPKILYEGDITLSELDILEILSEVGCDVLLIYQKGEEDYLKKDNNSLISLKFPLEKEESFPKNFSAKNLEMKIYNTENKPHMQYENLIETNTWFKEENIFESSLKENSQRGTNKNIYYNIFGGIYGVRDKNSFYGELFKWKTKLDSQKKKYVIVENYIPNPLWEEVENIKKRNIPENNQYLNFLLENINFNFKEAEKLLKRFFIDTVTGEENNIGKLSNRAITILCWLKRYISKLFSENSENNKKISPAFIFYGNPKSENEKIFLKLISKIPIDVIIICTDKTQKIEINDKSFIIEEYEYSLSSNEFPKSLTQINLKTTAYNAERELDHLLYENSGLFRKNQFKNAVPVFLETTYEEIEILWKQEAKYRQGFEILNDKVLVPVICAKICGVPQKETYWKNIETFLEEEGIFYSGIPFKSDDNKELFGNSLISFIKNGKLEKEKIKKFPKYRYNFIRNEMQDYILETIQKVLESKIIPNVFTGGMEFKILDTLLNLDLKILQLIQKYDFTKKIPKLVITDCGKNIGNIEDLIITVFLKFIGFDILLFVPTGYRSIEGLTDKNIFTEHEAGDYFYDMKVPEFDIEKRKFKSSNKIVSIFNFIN